MRYPKTEPVNGIRSAAADGYCSAKQPATVLCFVAALQVRAARNVPGCWPADGYSNFFDFVFQIPFKEGV